MSCEIEIRRDFLKRLSLCALSPLVGTALFNTNNSPIKLITVFSQKNLDKVAKLNDTSVSYQQLVELREQFIKRQLMYEYSLSYFGHLVFFETRFKNRKAMQLWLALNRQYESEIEHIHFNRFVIG